MRKEDEMETGERKSNKMIRTRDERMTKLRKEKP